MAYNIALAERIRNYLAALSTHKVKEKKMFGGLAFMVNDKMCICASGENLMCRFDPELEKELIAKKGYLPMVMRCKELKGYCYIEPVGFKAKKDFEYYISLCLEFNKKAKVSKKKS